MHVASNWENRKGGRKEKRTDSKGRLLYLFETVLKCVMCMYVGDRVKRKGKRRKERMGVCMPETERERDWDTDCTETLMTSGEDKCMCVCVL